MVTISCLIGYDRFLRKINPITDDPSSIIENGSGMTTSANGGVGSVPGSAGEPAPICDNWNIGGTFDVRNNTVLNSPDRSCGAENVHVIWDTPGTESVVAVGLTGPVVANSVSRATKCENGALSKSTLTNDPAEVMLSGLTLSIKVFILLGIVFSI